MIKKLPMWQISYETKILSKITLSTVNHGLMYFADSRTGLADSQTGLTDSQTELRT